MYHGKTIAVVIPAYNEQETIAAVIQGIPDFVDKIFVVDDGSSDLTGERAVKAGAQVIRHSLNQGLGVAFHTALLQVLEGNFDIMVNIDADGQFLPQDIPALLEPIVNDRAEFVTASRFMDLSLISNMPWIKRWGNHCVARLLNFLTGRRFHDVSCGFRAYSYNALSKLSLLGRFTYTHESFLNLAFSEIRIEEVPVNVQYFKERTSRVSQSIPRYMFHVLKIILRTYRDYRPLPFFWGIGLLLLPFSLGFGLFFLIHYLKAGHFSPHIWAGFVSAFLFCNSLAFFLLGIVADMFVRIRENQQRMIEMLYQERRQKRFPPS